MKAVLLDTNIISFIFKKDTRAESYQPYLQGENTDNFVYDRC